MIPSALRHAIHSGLTCDMTTIGRKSGQPRRIEIWYFVVDDAVYISGTPGARDWLANIRVNPTMIFHVKEGATADLDAVAVEIVDLAERRRIMQRIIAANAYFADGDVEQWVAASPLIRVDLR